MADIESSTVSETAASNTAAAPDGAPNNFARTATKNILREIWGGVKRFRNRITPTVTSAGTEPAFTLTYTTSPGSYVQGHVFAFKAHATPSGSVTLNVNTIGAKKVYDFYGNAQLGSAAWPANARVIVSYDTALDGGSGGFVWLNQGYSTTFSLTGQTAETTIATDDELLIADTSESGANNKITVANFLKIINALTEDTNPDESADFLLSWDNSASAVKKVAFVNYAVAASQMPSGSLVQSVGTVTGAVATGTTQMVLDDTIPQNTEGDQYMTQAITPTNASNILEIEVHWMGASDAGATAFMMAGLFQDTTANALAAAWAPCGASGQAIDLHFKHRMTAGTTSATTFKVRAGANASNTTTFNGRASGRIFGGVMSSSITVKEIKA